MLLTTALATAGVALGASTIPIDGGVRPIPWGSVPLFVALLALSAYPILQFRYRKEIESLDLFEAVLVPAIFALPGVALVPLAAAGVAISNVIGRNPACKTAFNSAQWACAAGAGSVVFNAIGGRQLTAATIAGLGLAVVVSSIINQVAVSFVIHLTERQPMRSALAGIAPGVVPAWMIGWTFNSVFGILFVVAYLRSPAMLALFIVPLFVLQRGYRERAGELVNRARLGALHVATRALADAEDPQSAITSFLSAVRDCFNAGAADLILLGRGQRTVHRLDEAGPISFTIREGEGAGSPLAEALLAHGEAVLATRDDPSLGRALADEGWRDCAAAPLYGGKRPIGLLVAYDRSGLEGFGEGELAILEALAGEAAGSIQRDALREVILTERRTLSEIVNYTSDGGFALDARGTVLMWNPGIETITGFPAEHMVGTIFPGRLAPHDAGGSPVRIEEWASDPVALPADVRIKTRMGETRWLSASYTRLPGTADRPEMLIVVARDVTTAHEAERMKEQFAATVAHELRRPLTPILGWAQFLRDRSGELPKRQVEEIADRIARQSERLNDIIENLLTISTLEHGGAARVSGTVDVRGVAERVVEEFRDSRPDRVIRLDEPPDPCGAAGDEVWLEQILANLLSNAIKYTPDDEPIEVRIDAGENSIAVEVRDHGPGIPAEQAERIFQSYQRLEGLPGRGGAGLGLYISRQLARALGGELDVRSEPGAGATFRLTLRR